MKASELRESMVLIVNLGYGVYKIQIKEVTEKTIVIKNLDTEKRYRIAKSEFDREYRVEEIFNK